MIIQTAPAGQPRLAIMMYEHTALAHQFARAFGNGRFEAADPLDLVSYIVLHHDAGWAEFDRDPVTDPTTNLPFNLIDTPAEYITVTSRLSPDFNQRHHAYSGLLSSMHSWGLYNGRYGLSSMVLIDKIPQQQTGWPKIRRLRRGSTSHTCSKTTSNCSSSTRSRSISTASIGASAAK
jgi:hypothetical protein